MLFGQPTGNIRLRYDSALSFHFQPELFIPKMTNLLPELLQSGQDSLYFESLASLTSANFFNMHLEKAESTAQKLESELFEISKDTLIWQHHLLRLSVFYAGKSDFHYAEVLCRKALDLIHQSPPPPDKTYQGDVYTNLGYLLKVQGDALSAEQYYRYAIQYHLNAEVINHSRLATGYSNLGRLFYEKGDLIKAKSAFLSAYSEFQEMQLSKQHEFEFLSATLGYISKVYLQLNMPDSCKFYLDKTLDLPNLRPNYQANIQKYLGDYYLYKHENETANRYYKEALSSNKRQYGERNNVITETYLRLAELAVKNRDTTLSIEYHLAAVQSLPASTVEFPSVQSLKAWEGLGNIYLLNRQYSNALPAFETAINQLLLLRKGYLHIESKNYLSTHTQNIFSNAFRAAWLSYEECPERAFLEAMWRISEWNKAAFVYEKNQEEQFYETFFLEDSLYLDWQKLKSNFNYLQKKLLDLTSVGDSIYLKLNSDVIQARERISKFEEGLSAANSNMAGYLKPIALPLLSEAETFSQSRDAAICSVFWGEESVYFISIILGKTTVTSIPAELLETKIQNFLNYSTQQGASYFNDSLWIFPEDFMGGNKVLIKNLLIIPDKNLCLIPWENILALTKRTDFDSILDIPVLYSFSFEVFIKKTLATSSRMGKFLAFAPITYSDHLRLSPLEYSSEEIRSLKNFYNYTFTGKPAGFEAFISHFPESAVFHLATHAGLDSTGANPWLALSDTIIALSDLYGMSFHPELVVLSACETGLGQYRPGEGIMSLSRGFALAGARSMVSSLWKVNDAATSQLFGYFYQHLRKGVPRAQALRQAKLDYLAHAPERLRHPYYWAGFVYYGPDEPVDWPRQHNLWWTLLCLPLGLWGIWWYRRRLGVLNIKRSV